MINNSLFLVTTNLKESRKENERTLFLGEWALEHELQKQLGDQALVVPFHWADYNKLEKDYVYLDDLYERLLRAISNYLNSHHQVDYSERYWRILIGPWLGIFIQIFYERWESVSYALSHFTINGTIVLDIPCEDVIPLDTQEFSKLMTTDEWNHYLFSVILDELGVDIPKESRPLTTERDTYHSIRESDEGLKKKAIGFLKNLLNRLTRHNKVFIGSSYLGFFNDSKLNFKLGQLPAAFKSIPVTAVKADVECRKRLRLPFASSNAFEKKLCQIIFLHIPICMMEGFRQLLNDVDKLPYPSAPKVIFTSNFLAYDTLAMAYTSKQVNNGCKLIHGQHGGYGIPAFMNAELHERKIADVFLSWGWSDSNAVNIAPVGMLNPINGYKRQNGVVVNDLLLVRGLWPRYTFRLDSGVGLSLNDAIEDSLNLAGYLPPTIRNASLLVRLYHRDYGFQERQRWEKRFPGIRIDKGKSSITSLVSQAKLVIYSYNIGTGYLEYMNANIPTIAFWDMKVSPVRKEAEPYFDRLRLVGIFHDTPESAAKHIQKIWNDVQGWWESVEVRKAKAAFCAQYAKINEALIPDIATIIKKELSKTQ